MADVSTKNHLSSPWTPERIEGLIKLWPGDLSATDIAKELGGGLTKNAVVGKAKRLKLENRDQKKYQVIQNAGRLNRRGMTHATRIERMKQQRELAIAFPARVKAMTKPTSFLNLTFDELEWQDGVPSNCRFALGDSPFLFCGQKPVVEKSSYCATCYPVVFGRFEATLEQIARAAKMRAAKFGRAA